MNIKIPRYKKNTGDQKHTAVSSSLLQKCIIGVLKDPKHDKNQEEKLTHALGELAFLYSQREVCLENVMEFVEQVFDFIPNLNKFIVQHISNFMEIVLVHNPQIIQFYLGKLKENSDIEGDNAAILYSSVIYSVLENKFNLKNIINRIEYPWRSYFRLTNYYLFYDDNVNALNSIIRAIKTCPLELKGEYIKKRDYIISNF